ncbi:MAG TPA: DUF2911 domain-containing protein [Vicinamibacteria bacterium]|jgi:hypothetical protein|nr:DUF2911 domain-containing protein [Vicinamibacteria bacterium]
MILKQTCAAGVVLILSALPGLAHGADRGKTTVPLSGKTVSVDYGRPNLNGRDMLGKAEIGKPWRLGADAPTTLTSDVDLAFGSLAVPKGSYVLTATRTADAAWAINITRPGKDNAKAEKVGDVPLTIVTLPDSVEQLTIDLKAEAPGASLTVSWGKTALKTNFTAK